MKKIITVHLNNFTTALTNIFMFLPYYFSVSLIIKSLFSPWKNISLISPATGTSIDKFLSRLSDNLVSRGMGFIFRIFTLLSYLLLMILFVILLPFIIIVYLLILPILTVYSILTPSDQEKYLRLKKIFISNHDPKNKYPDMINDWFDRYYQNIHLDSWWSRKNLFSILPIGRSWLSGYTPVLDTYSVDLTIPHPHHKNLINRKNELEAIQQQLIKSESNDILLIGEDGVGKRIIINSLAKLIYLGKSNKLLSYKRILQLDLEKILSQTEDYIKREQIISQIFDEAAAAKNIIIFIHGLDKYISTDTGRIDLSVTIAKYAKADHLQIITTTTPYYYQKYIYPNKIVDNNFNKINIDEISSQYSLEVLTDIATEFEKRYDLIIPYAALVETISLSTKYILDLPMPEKAIELLDEVCIFTKNKLKQNVIDYKTISHVIEQKLNIPISIDQEFKDILISLDKMMKNKIFFQDEHIDTIVATIRKSLVISRDQKKPIASFLFLGPTGVGKTYTAKVLSNIFQTKNNLLLRFDMSQYQNKTDIDKLIGSSTSGDPGLMTTAIRNNKFGVLLLDELEKANHNLLNIFLTMLDEGYYTDDWGRKVDCKNLIIIAKSNAGSDFLFELSKNPKINKNQYHEKIIDYLIKKKIYSPEFLNRFDNIIVFNPLTKQATYHVAKQIVSDLSEEIGTRSNITINVSDEYLKQLVDKSFNEKFGARNMQRVITDDIENQVSMAILENKVKSGSNLTL